MYPLTASKVERDKGSDTGWFVERPMSDYVIEKLSLEMRVDSDALKTVVFIGAEARGVFVPVGTGFIARYPYSNWSFFFVATANHVLDLIDGDFVYVRMNRKDGTSSSIRFEKNTVIRHSNAHNDIALLAITRSNGVFDQHPILINREDLAARRSVWNPDIGDEVVTVGLYGTHFGSVRNIPVVRIGNIAMMPGAPVFCNAPAVRIEKGQVHTLNNPTYIPIGVMIGYHLVATAQDQIQVPNGEDGPTRLTADERNTGFAVVVPIERLFDILEDGRMKEGMDERIGSHLKSSSFRPAGRPIPVSASFDLCADAEAAEKLSPSTEAAENPQHREDFTSLLNAAAKTKPQGD
jgi:hypothetical protein